MKGILTETPKEDLAPGLLRRLEALEAHLEFVEFRSLGPLTDKGRIHRWQRASSFDLAEADGPKEWTILALSAPHMLILALRLSRAGKLVRVDVCDSWTLQFLSRLKSRRLDLALLSAFGALIQCTLLHDCVVSYISERDRRADRWLNFRHSTETISQYSTALTHRGSRSEKIERVVVAGDYRSFHLKKGMGLLTQAWSAYGQNVSDGLVRLQLHVYGIGNSGCENLPSTIVHGFVNDLEELYAPGSVLYVPNVAGSGVPNKVLEALVRGCPLILHRSLVAGLPDGAEYYEFRSGRDLARIFASLGAR